MREVCLCRIGERRRIIAVEDFSQHEDASDGHQTEKHKDMTKLDLERSHCKETCFAVTVSEPVGADKLPARDIQTLNRLKDLGDGQNTPETEMHGVDRLDELTDQLKGIVGTEGVKKSAEVGEEPWVFFDIPILHNNIYRRRGSNRRTDLISPTATRPTLQGGQCHVARRICMIFVQLASGFGQ
jgi:hypothetical protein